MSNENIVDVLSDIECQLERIANVLEKINFFDGSITTYENNSRLSR